MILQAEKVGEQAYMIEWYRLPRKVSLSMIYVIRMSHNPAKLTAGKMIPLSMSTFSQVSRYNNLKIKSILLFNHCLYKFCLSL